MTAVQSRVRCPPPGRHPKRWRTCRWARLDSNQGPTDYDLQAEVSVGLGLPEDSSSVSGIAAATDSLVS